MSMIREAAKREPVVVINSVVAVVESAIIFLIAAGFVEMSKEAEVALIALVLAVGTMLQTLFSRQRVSPVER